MAFPTKLMDTLFAHYVKTASGYPEHAVSDVDKRVYIDDYFEKENIRLNPDKIAVNQAQRSINKLLLNSLWGRFSMRENLPSSEMLKDPEQFAQYIFGAFRTAHARLELYDLMDKLGDRLLYSDTDSVVFVSKDGDWEPPLGPYLGDLTDEIGGGDHITEFSSAGPKTYGYRMASGNMCMKAKGITLNAENSKLIKLDTLIDLVDHHLVDRDNTRHILARTDKHSER